MEICVKDKRKKSRGTTFVFIISFPQIANEENEVFPLLLRYILLLYDDTWRNDVIKSWELSGWTLAGRDPLLEG